MKHLTVISPCFNEAENIPKLISQTKKVLSQISSDYQHIIVDNGSTDGTLPLLLNQKQKQPHLYIISLSRNFGYQGALQCGLDQADAKYVGIMDGDLQDPPKVFVRMYQTLTKHKLDFVYGVKSSRNENWFKNWCYYFFYRIWSHISEINIPLDAGEFCLMTRSTAKLLADMPERNKFLRGLRAWIGYKSTGITYARQKRYAGRSKFSFYNSITFALDAIFPFSKAPARLSLLFGLVFGMVASLLLLVIIYLYIFTDIFVPGYASLVSLFLFTQSANFIILGILGEYLIRSYEETKNRPRYLIQQQFK